MYENKVYENKDGTKILPYENKAFYSIIRNIQNRGTVKGLLKNIFGILRKQRVFGLLQKGYL